MYSDLLLPYLQKEIIEGYFEICRYFVMTKSFGKEEDLTRISFYRSLLLSDPLPKVPLNNKLDLEIISSTKEVKTKLSDTYSPDFIINIIDSGVHMFFDKMERYAAIDVRLRSLPDLFSFFNAMTPVILQRLKESIQKEFCKPSDLSVKEYSSPEKCV